MSGTVIQDDLTVEGNLTAKDGTVIISGNVVGDIDANVVEILSSGRVRGGVTAVNVTLSGALEGSVKCSELTLEEEADLKADVSAKTMSMSSGTKVHGKVAVG
ncbi:polymer-forming cytoskeletal protein [Tropicimonas sp. IMCC6043]|uniref:bactofilin family protein n=1 Tax=Tropicimonas sp. IMCC6043 TaxID=2510645 RepID=UPI00101B82B4|nr:polymer-forming cytoskeletal protein [Tropicimonas sp. IMCC6043]RYH07314.1 polymer-forming cytoskeletal protein [Tropicimonas sp. IMCC6043]